MSEISITRPSQNTYGVTLTRGKSDVTYFSPEGLGKEGAVRYQITALQAVVDAYEEDVEKLENIRKIDQFAADMWLAYYNNFDDRQYDGQRWEELSADDKEIWLNTAQRIFQEQTSSVQDQADLHSEDNSHEITHENSKSTESQCPPDGTYFTNEYGGEYRMFGSQIGMYSNNGDVVILDVSWPEFINSCGLITITVEK